mmetsp:Transcript_28759/g.82598  ORF Transcript_28759/g.82598 Transcript_28759/m.82598 type:complete len:235 (+) Transcript_28759:2613-3317(+)
MRERGDGPPHSVFGLGLRQQRLPRVLCVRQVRGQGLRGGGLQALRAHRLCGRVRRSGSGLQAVSRRRPERARAPPRATGHFRAGARGRPRPGFGQGGAATRDRGPQTGASGGVRVVGVGRCRQQVHTAHLHRRLGLRGLGIQDRVAPQRHAVEPGGGSHAAGARARNQGGASSRTARSIGVGGAVPLPGLLGLQGYHAICSASLSFGHHSPFLEPPGHLDDDAFSGRFDTGGVR